MTTPFPLSRRNLLRMLTVAGAAASVGLPSAPSARTAPTGPSLVLRPTRVFKTPDRSHENTESWIFSLLVQAAEEGTIEPLSMTVVLLKNGHALRTTTYTGEGFAPLTIKTPLQARMPDGSATATPMFWPLLIRLRHIEPIALGVDAMRIDVQLKDAHGRKHKLALSVPVETYAPKTSLVFPFRGKGIILQAGASNGGHRNRSGQFALDAMGLDDAWSPVAAGDGKTNTDYPGFGRPLIAPADGLVVRARSDRPDQPVADASDPAYYAPEYKNGGDPGNHVVIDHGNGEFSLLAHFQAGSLQVALGDRVTQGQALGKLGHSGDTDGPHLHYQLQTGPDWEQSDALPCSFSNVEQKILDRGSYFETK